MRAIFMAFMLLVMPATGVAGEWLSPDLENVLIIETGKGRLIVELRPEIAPAAVERIRLLARRGFYDGLQFHRVIANFVAQTGNPNNKDGGRSELANLAPEFTFRMGAETPHVIVASPQGLTQGFIGSLPYVSNAEARVATAPDSKVKTWGTYCTGVMGMGRGEATDSANSEIFFMLAAHPRLDRDYTVTGRVIGGEAHLQALATGEPPVKPDLMLKVRVMSDMAPAERPKIDIMNVASPAFASLIARTRRARGADFSVCDIRVPVRIDGRPEK